MEKDDGYGEGSHISKEVWDSLYPTLAKSKGKVLVVSTPRGNNSFFAKFLDWKKGRNPPAAKP